MSDNETTPETSGLLTGVVIGIVLAQAKRLALNLTELDVVAWVRETEAVFRPIAKEKGVT